MADNSGIIDAAIINFPATLQQNALRATQIQNAQQIQQQNALKLQQQQAGINALRNAYSSNQFDPRTGLLSAPAMSSLIAADPNLGLDFADARTKQQEYATRARLQQIVANDHYMNIFKTGVVDPLLDYYNSLQGLHLSLPEIDQKLQQKKAELTKNMVQEYAPPPDVAERMGNIPFNSNNAPTWAAQSEILQKRATNFSKNFELQTDSTGEKYYTNKTPGYQGVYYDTGFNPKPPNWRPTGLPYEKPELEPFTDIGDPKKPIYNYNKTGPDKGKFTDQDGNIVTPKHAVPASRSVTSERPLPAPQQAQITDPNTGKVTSGEVYRYPDGRVVDANTNQDLDPKNVNITKDVPMSPPAVAYMAERDALGLHMQAAWATSKYLPQMAERDIRASLGLSNDAQLTEEDGTLAALNDVVNQHAIKSQGQALSVIAKQNALVGSFENTALRNANLVEQLGPKGVAGGDLLWNRFRNASRREIGIDPDLSKLDLAVTDLKNEYVRIMSTAAGTGSMTSDQARTEGDRLFNVNQPWDIMKGNLAIARQTMKNRTDSIQGQYDTTLKSIRNKGAYEEQPALPPTAGQESNATKPPTMPDADKAKLPHDGSAVWYKGVGTRLGSGGVVQFFIDGKWQ